MGTLVRDISEKYAPFDKFRFGDDVVLGFGAV
jgi:hypothetical protein